MIRGASVATAGKRGEKKSEALARQILRDITARRLRPGAMLPPEATMLADYEVGRTTLREALRILEVQSVLSIRPGPGGGPVVGEADHRGYARVSSLFFQAGGVRLLDVMEARVEMEPAMARLAAERRDPQALQGIQQAMTRLEQSVNASAAQFKEAGRVFLEAVAEAAGQPVLSLFCRALDQVVSERMARFCVPADRRAGAVAQQVAIGRAILRGSGATAERLMREYMLDHNRCAAEGRSGGVKSVVSWG
jgi:GntR family transcriptional repressor for pyruvate dehydrogenase complex